MNIRCFPILLLLMTNMALGNNEKIEIKQIAKNIYQHISYKEVAPWGKVGATGLIVVNNHNAHIIDTPWTQEETETLISWLKLKNLTLQSAVITHFHDDASGGIEALYNANIKTYATPLTNKLLRAKQSRASSNEITNSTFELVKDTIEIYYPGPGHTIDNIVVWLPQNKLLFGGCFLKSLKSKNLGNTQDAFLNDWATSIHNVINQYPQIKIVVPGHGKIGDKNILQHTQQLIKAGQNSNFQR